jgi:hypothetical protein
MKSVPERLVVQFDKHGKEEQETETRTAGESLLDCYLYVICVCYLALGQKTSAPPVKGGLPCRPTHNNLVSLGLCCERSRLALPPWWSHAIKSLSGRMFPLYSP